MFKSVGGILGLLIGGVIGAEFGGPLLIAVVAGLAGLAGVVIANHFLPDQVRQA